MAIGLRWKIIKDNIALINPKFYLDEAQFIMHNTHL